MSRAEGRVYGIRLDERFFISKEARALLKEKDGTAVLGALAIMLFAAESRGGELSLIDMGDGPVPITGIPADGKALAKAFGYAVENGMACISEDGCSVSFPVLSAISSSVTASAIRMRRMRSREEADNA